MQAVLLLIARRGWLGLLAATPQPLLRRLDAWAQAQAERRADKRRQALQAARARG